MLEKIMDTALSLGKAAVMLDINSIKLQGIFNSVLKETILDSIERSGVVSREDKEELEILFNRAFTDENVYETFQDYKDGVGFYVKEALDKINVDGIQITEADVLNFKNRLYGKIKSEFPNEYGRICLGDIHTDVKDIKDTLNEIKDENKGFSKATSKLALTVPPTRPLPNLIGREGESEKLEVMLENNDKVVLVNGLGGIGKTQLCRKYFWENYERYGYYGWVDCMGRIRDSLVGQVVSEKIRFDEKEDTDSRFEKIMAFLSGLGSDGLMVFDNIEDMEDRDLDRIRRLKCRVLASSRSRLHGFERLELDFLSEEDCVKLFFEYYEQEERSGQSEAHVREIVRLVGYHTLTVELLAKTANDAGKGSAEFYKVLVDKGFASLDGVREKVKTEWDGKRERMHYFGHLCKVFELSDLSKDEKYVLANLSVLPASGVRKSEFGEWLKLESLGDVNGLVRKGWLSEQMGVVGMHRMVAEVVRDKMKPDAGVCGVLVRALGDRLDYRDERIYSKEYVGHLCGESVLECLGICDVETGRLANNLSTVYKIKGELERALYYQEKAVKIGEEILGEKHPDLAASYNNLSSIYKAKGELEKALHYQEKAIKIREEILGEKHPSLAISYNNLSSIYFNNRNFQDARIHLEKAIAIYNHNFSNGHPQLEIMMENLAILSAIEAQSKKTKDDTSI